MKYKIFKRGNEVQLKYLLWGFIPCVFLAYSKSGLVCFSYCCPSELDQWYDMTETEIKDRFETRKYREEKKPYTVTEYDTYYEMD